jgi:RNA polymerase sigma-70 factor (ECF subfamily)
MSQMNDPPGPRQFATTRWSLVLAAKPDAASQTLARDALEELCKAYWYPLYSFVRNRGYLSSDAQDLTQSFFAQLIETHGIASADPRRGRFRSYLLGALKHFLVKNRGMTVTRHGHSFR